MVRSRSLSICKVAKLTYICEVYISPASLMLLGTSISHDEKGKSRGSFCQFWFPFEILWRFVCCPFVAALFALGCGFVAVARPDRLILGPLLAARTDCKADEGLINSGRWTCSGKDGMVYVGYFRTISCENACRSCGVLLVCIPWKRNIQFKSDSGGGTWW